MSRKRLYENRWICRALAFLPMFLFALDAFARAGGGGNYSGGHSSSSGGFSGGGGYSGGGGGGSGDLSGLFQALYWLFYLTIHYPIVMLPLWAIAIFFAYRQLTKNAGEPSAPIRRLERQRLAPADDASDGFTDLRARDPAFDENAFRERTKKIFHEIQDAWFLRDLNRARMFMSDGVFRRFATLETIMKLEGRRDAMADDLVQHSKIAAVDATSAYDVVTVELRASMRDVDVPATMSDDDARKKAKKEPSQPFTEMWTFVRRQGAKTREGFDLGQGKCPNCGADFHGGQTNTCDYCKAVVNSGNYDWVLSEITQAEEFLPPAVDAPGLDALRARDANAAPEVLEDRALLLFWKWLEAFAADNAKVIQKLARPEFLAGVSGKLEVFRQKGSHAVVKVPAVGGADVVAVEVDDGGWDRVHVDVRWSGVVAMDPSESLGRLAQRPRRHIVQMVRKTGASTDQGTGLATERCGNCHAPLTNSDSTSCEYCGTDLSAGTSDWILENVVAYEAWSRPSASRPHATAAFATKSERIRLLQVLTAIAKADGVVDDSEKRLLAACAKRWGVPWNEVEVLLAGDGSFDADALTALPTAQKAELFGQLVAMVKIDGKLHPKERALMAGLAPKLGVTAETLERVLAA